MAHEFDPVAFRAMFPEFTDPPYTDALLATYWEIATCAISTVDNCVLGGDCLQTALMLMTAHIAKILGGASQGNTAVGAQTGATVDKVSVTFAAPPYKSGWQAWLAQTPYGMTLWALLSAKASGGWYIGGLPESSAIRKVGGIF